jgi:uncharacterized protein
VRVILHTNVLISGVFFGGLPRQILVAWRRGVLRVVFSPEILDEYERVGDRLAQRFKGVDLDPFLQLLGVHGELVEAAALTEPVTDDPADDKFFACALASGVRVIISGDEDLHQASGWRGVEVVRPAEFCQRFLTDDEA